MFRIIASIALLLLATVPIQAAAQSEYQDQVQKMYVAYYGRPGDPGGVDYWAEQLQLVDGELAAIIDAFGNSAEYDSRFTGLTTEQLINNIYQQLLGRDADSGGLAFYAEGYDDGSFTLASIALNIADGISGTDDADTYENKLASANAFTAAIADSGASYGADEIDDAVTLLSNTRGTDTQEDVLASVDALIDDLLAAAEPADPPASDEPLDITNLIFEETSGDCALYAHLYEASVLDIQRGLSFAASIEISSDGSNCTLI